MDGSTFSGDDACRAAIPRVLIVQPNRTYLGVLARRISEGGYRVATAETVSAAMVELHRQHIDLILCELRMPKIGGVELVQIIRDDPIHRDIPVFLLTGRLAHHHHVRVLPAFAEDHVGARLRQSTPRTPECNFAHFGEDW